MLRSRGWGFVFLIPLALALNAGAKDPRAEGAANEKKLSGSVQRVEEYKCEVCNCVELTAFLKTDAGTVPVKLGPKSYFAERDFVLSSGDMVEVTGIRSTEKGRRVILANEVRKGGESLTLRGKSGKPAWLLEHGHPCPSCGN